MSENNDPFGSWAMLELMGHRRLAGYVSEAEMFGTTMVRVDVPHPDRETPDTQFYSAAAVYCVTPTSEEEVQKYLRPPPRPSWALDPVYEDDDEGFDGEPDFSP